MLYYSAHKTGYGGMTKTGVLIYKMPFAEIQYNVRYWIFIIHADKPYQRGKVSLKDY
jgi:hypothetical protein